MRQPAADAVIIQNGKLLLVRRNTEPFRGMWALPAGRLEENETFEECCIREVKEETGLGVKIEKLIGVYSDPKRDPRKTVTVAFLCTVKEGKETPQKGEIKEVKWFQSNNLPALAFDHKKIIECALKMTINSPSRKPQSPRA